MNGKGEANDRTGETPVNTTDINHKSLVFNTDKDEPAAKKLRLDAVPQERKTVNGTANTAITGTAGLSVFIIRLKENFSYLMIYSFCLKFHRNCITMQLCTIFFESGEMLVNTAITHLCNHQKNTK